MSNRNIRHKKFMKGFTLIELSIVLVIIGLLTAGVIGGQSLIESSKLNSVLSDTSKYQSAVNAFRLEYGSYPGDLPTATDYWGAVSGSCLTVSGTGTQTCNGDGDNRFEYAYDPSTEPWRAWQHLALAGVIPGKYTGISNNSLCVYVNMCAEPWINAPGSAIEGTSWNLFFVGDNALHVWKGKAEDRNVLAFGSPKNQANHWFGPALTPKQMSSIDVKVDDGYPGSGIVTNVSDANGTAVGGNNPNCTIISGGRLIYRLTYTTHACTMFFDLL